MGALEEAAFRALAVGAVVLDFLEAGGGEGDAEAELARLREGTIAKWCV